MNPKDLNRIIEEKETERIEWRGQIISEIQQIAKQFKIDIEGLNEDGVISLAINLNYYRRVFSHALGMALWYLESLVEKPRFDAIVTEQIGLSIRSSYRLRAQAKFFFNYPQEFVSQLGTRKKDFLMSLPEELLEGFEQQDSDLNGVTKEDIVRLPVKELEERILKATDGATNALKKELDLKNQLIQEMNREIEQLREEKESLTDPEGKNPIRDKKLLNYVVEIEYALIRLNQFLDNSPLPEHLRGESGMYMDRLDSRVDELRRHMANLAMDNGWQPDPDRMAKADHYQQLTGSDTEE